MAAAEITAFALERDLPHVALGAAREAARSALMALGSAPRRLPATDLGLLQDMAAAFPQHLAGCPAERTAMVRATLSVVGRLFPRPPAAACRDSPRGGGAGRPSHQGRIGMRPEMRPRRRGGAGGPGVRAAVACPGDGLPDRRAKLKLKDERVLVVEDEALVSMLVEDGLRDAGATVLGLATTVGDALRLVEAAAPMAGSARRCSTSAYKGIR